MLVDFITGFKHKSALVSKLGFHFSTNLLSLEALRVGFLDYSTTNITTMEDHSKEKLKTNIVTFVEFWIRFKVGAQKLHTYACT